MTRACDDIETLKRRARICAESHTAWVYERNYAGPTVRRFIAVREPTVYQTCYTRLFTHDYEQLIDCSPTVARRHLRLLVNAGFLQERKTTGGCTSWYITDHDERVAIGRRIIEKLKAQGLQFDDER